ncbi:MAG TPA: L,D-transpeptidase family protein, partial [Candidatus Absconditabacterales bacterium]|nr:L,D-transpeptidase family protein [Candidatus Absconditabacterales bacterium]
MKNIEKNRDRKDGRVAKVFRELMFLTAILLSTTLALPKKSSGQTMNNKNNYSVTITKLSVSDYQKMIDQRDKNIQAQLDNWDSKETVTEYLERTQKEIFLSSYKHNKNMVRNNIDKIGIVLKNKYGHKELKDPIEILNTAIRKIANSGKIEGLSIYANKINVGVFNKNTIDAIGFIEARYKLNKAKKTQDEKVTFNPSAIGVLDIVLEVLETTTNTGDYAQEAKQQNQGTSGKVREEFSKKLEPTDTSEGIIILDDDDDEEVTTKEVPKTTNEKEQTKQPDQVKQVKSEPDKTEQKIVTPTGSSEGIIILDDDYEQDDEIPDIVDLKAPEQKEEMNMFVQYNFQKDLAQSLPIQTQRDRIEQLMNEHEVVQKFIQELEGVGINFKNGENTDVNRTAAILRTINGDFELGFDAINSAKASNMKGAKVVELVIFKSIVSDENLKIVEQGSRNLKLLEASLSKDKLNGISYQEILDAVDGFRDNELKKVFMYHLLNNNIIAAQKVMGLELDCDSRYPDYKAGSKLGKSELNKIKKLGNVRKYLGQDEIMANSGIPQDVKDIYMKFVNGELNHKGKQYSILSKTDFNIYFFSNNHRLLSRQNTLIGSEVGDHQNNPMAGSRTTPGGLYEVGRAVDKTTSGQSFFVKYGTHYIILIPLNGQYTISEQYTMGIHGTYEKDPSRDQKIKSKNAKDRRESNGCINVE